jgi:DNA-binding SARP family transcriptional activator
MQPEEITSLSLNAALKADFNPIKNLVLTGDYTEGLNLYASLEQPSANDERWVGVCHFALGNQLEAKMHLSQAIAGGERAAGIELASVYRTQGFVDLALNQLNLVNAALLHVADQARLARERAELILKSGDLERAAIAFEEALMLSEVSDERQWLSPAILQSLGFVQSERGDFGAAIQSLSQVIIHKQASPIRIAAAFATRALVFAYSGKLNAARQDIERGTSALANLESGQWLLVMLKFADGITSWLEEHADQAIETLMTVSREAMNFGERELSVYAQAQLVVIHLERRDTDRARAHISLARAQVDGENAQAICDLREAQLYTHLNQAVPAMLERAVAYFSRTQHRREMAIALFHLADAYASRRDFQAANMALNRVTDLTHMFEGKAFLNAEFRGLRGLNQLQNHASSYAGWLFSTATTISSGSSVPRIFEVKTFGQPHLLVDGQRIEFGSHRALELLVFLGLHPNSSLEQIIAALSPDDDPKSAKNLFHQLKFILNRHARGLKIEYHTANRTYALNAGSASLEFDTVQLTTYLQTPGQPGLSAALELYVGEFLVTADTQWASEVRSKMEWMLVESGVKVVYELLQEGELEACKSLSRSLLKLEPGDIGLNRLLIEVTRRVEGELAAQIELERAQSRFRGLGVVVNSLSMTGENDGLN